MVFFFAEVNYIHIVLSVPEGVHTLRHDNPSVTFGVMVYGLKNSESYGYPGGLRLALSGESSFFDLYANYNPISGIA